MQPLKADEILDRIVSQDSRYHREAYLFVRDALDFTQRQITKSERTTARHVCGKELLEGIRAFALEQFGPMTVMVLEEWGVKKCDDFGELVFNMVEMRLLSKTATDSREDFHGGYDFFEAFRRPFLPSTPVPSDVKIPAKPATQS